MSPAMFGMYILRKRKPQPCGNVRDWYTWMAVGRRQVARTRISADVIVSTVFLGVDHNWTGKGGPVLFETMVFGGKMDMYQARARSWKDAVRCHQVAFLLARGFVRAEVRSSFLSLLEARSAAVAPPRSPAP